MTTQMFGGICNTHTHIHTDRQTSRKPFVCVCVCYKLDNAIYIKGNLYTLMMFILRRYLLQHGDLSTYLSHAGVPPFRVFYPKCS